MDNTKNRRCIMSVEDIMMEAYYEGLRDEVFGILNEHTDDWKYKEYGDKYGRALDIARRRKTKGKLRHSTKRKGKKHT
jgi:hypothetical protein